MVSRLFLRVLNYGRCVSGTVVGLRPWDWFSAKGLGQWSIRIVENQRHACQTKVLTGLLDISGALPMMSCVISMYAGSIGTRLISDVVTGKLDVREAAAELPDEPGETKPFDEAAAVDDDEIETEELGK